MLNYHNVKYYLLCYLVDTDIAFNKPADSSSTHNDNKNLYGPQYVNNGKANCAHPSGPIAHTKSVPGIE